MQPIISIRNVDKTYASGFRALKDINLDIGKGEIFALLGPNGAGKTTLISIICGIVNLGGGSIVVDGHDVVRDFRITRSIIGLVPQELTTDAFETVWNTVSFSRGLFGKAANPAHIERVLKDLSLWDKRDARIMMLSGGMKRRVMIAKALSHEPRVLFLDEPTAGVDVELRRDLWSYVRKLRAEGTTVILTTHYLEEAEELADRIGVINKGKLLLVEDKQSLMGRLGERRLEIRLREPHPLPEPLASLLQVSADGKNLTYVERPGHTPLPEVIEQVYRAGLPVAELETRRSRLEEILIQILHGDGNGAEVAS